MTVQSRQFASSSKSWEALCAEASAFATEVGRERLINISVAASGGTDMFGLGGTGVIVVWSLGVGTDETPRLVTAGCILAMLSTSSAAKQAGKVLIGYCVGLKGLEIAKVGGVRLRRTRRHRNRRALGRRFRRGARASEAGWHSHTQRQSIYPWKHQADGT